MNHLNTSEFYDIEESYNEYYNDFVLFEINEAVNILMYSQDICDSIRKFIVKKSEQELICEIVNNYYKTNTIKLNFHCDNFIAKFSWNEKTKNWKYSKITLD
jgi:hypothetical protein